MGVSFSYSIEKFRHIDGPLVDIRSPIEFKKGHWPGATNIPLFSDEERSNIGTSFKKQGKDKAILLGLEYLSPRLKQFQHSLELILNNSIGSRGNLGSKNLRIYCWRGGLRSTGVKWLAKLLDLKPVVLDGGYKSYRKWVLKKFEQKLPIQLIGGKTGTGKTDLLLALASKGAAVIDLEGLAEHRGSSFGSLGKPLQPTTEHFENTIAEAIEEAISRKSSAIWIEAESANLGKCRVPNDLFKQMKSAPLVEIIRSKEERVSQLIEVYACQSTEMLEEATLRIRKRLGPQRTSEAIASIKRKDWASACEAILDYYDRCYEHDLKHIKIKQKLDVSGEETSRVADILINQEILSHASINLEA